MGPFAFALPVVVAYWKEPPTVEGSVPVAVAVSVRIVEGELALESEEAEEVGASDP